MARRHRDSFTFLDQCISLSHLSIDVRSTAIWYMQLMVFVALTAFVEARDWVDREKNPILRLNEEAAPLCTNFQWRAEKEVRAIRNTSEPTIEGYGSRLRFCKERSICIRNNPFRSVFLPSRPASATCKPREDILHPRLVQMRLALDAIASFASPLRITTVGFAGALGPRATVDHVRRAVCYVKEYRDFVMVCTCAPVLPATGVGAAVRLQIVVISSMYERRSMDGTVRLTARAVVAKADRMMAENCMLSLDLFGVIGVQVVGLI